MMGDPFIAGSYILTLGALAGALGWEWLRMRRAEKKKDRL